ncbi:MAG: nucleoside phosphorylase [Candidatus Doudnabacteria bacterium]|nr:nucleoside phosphorylase [Candidatus Doudnabacteria bacterium]
MSFPNYPDKYKYKSLFTAKDYNNYLRTVGQHPDFEIPKGVIFCYSRTLLKDILESVEHTVVPRFFAGDFYLLNDNGVAIGISGNFGAGAPVVTSVLEELAELGVKNFVSIGQAGALQPNLEIGSYVVCEKAIRDEGVSHHYVKSEKYASADPDLTNQLKKSFEKLDVTPAVGTSWTTDAPYRETVDEIKQYQSEGVLTVEMEASALFAVAQYLKVRMASAFMISDSLADIKWNPQLRHPDSQKWMRKLYSAAVGAISEI